MTTDVITTGTPETIETVANGAVLTAPAADKLEAEQQTVETNGRVLGKIELPKPAEQSPVVQFSCALCGEKGGGIREEQAIVPNLNFVEAKLGKKAVPEDLRSFLVCRKHANALEDRGVRCYRYLNSVRFLEERIAGNKGVDAFVGDYGKRPTPLANKSSAAGEPKPAPLKAPIPFEGKGRDFASPAASKPKSKKVHNGGRRDKDRRVGWADHGA